MFYEPKDGHGLPRNPLNACVVPRPIAWISTLSEDGIANLAPFSHSNLVSIVPPMVMFSGSGRHKDGDIKDSVLNAELTGEFVYNMATWDTREAMNLSSGYVERTSDEFEIAGSPIVGGWRNGARPVRRAFVSTPGLVPTGYSLYYSHSSR